MYENQTVLAMACGVKGSYVLNIRALVSYIFQLIVQYGSKGLEVSKACDNSEVYKLR